MAANGTVFEFVSSGKVAYGAGLLVVPLVIRPQPPMEVVQRVDAVCNDAVSELLTAQAVGDEAGYIAHTMRAGVYRRVLVVSLGEAASLDGLRLRTAAAALARWLISEKCTQASLWLDGLLISGHENAVLEWSHGMALAGFQFSQRKSGRSRGPQKMRVHVCSSESSHVSRAMPAIREGIALGEAVNYARSIAHEPPNVINPATLAEEARRLARSNKLKCTILAEPQLRRLKMNGILSVGCSATPGPCLIQLDYNAAPRAATRTILVGKAVTFDTGGYSIKPADGMEAMKFDKCGGVTVLGVMKAISDLKLKCNVTGLIAAAENAISDRAYRPADIITMASGKTVEIISTDAEGRMLLADALWYAQEKLGGRVLIDLATLTGGARICLGTAAACLMSNDDDLSAELAESGRGTQERLWRLPLWDEYRELIKSPDADIKNSAGKRDAHTIVGGMFLREFVRPEVSWAHLDIAAVATRDDTKLPTGKGATGFGIRLLVDFLRRRAR